MDDKTRNNRGGFFSGPTRRVRENKDSTRKVSQPVETDTPPAPQEEKKQKRSPLGDVTCLARSAGTPPPGQEKRSTPEVTEHEYTVGWLVVLDGMGKGASLQLYHGLNTIGRGESQTVQLDFGDEQISRENHCSIAYDERNRQFFVQHGGGRNLTYLDDQPVLSSTPLSSSAKISLGGTVLRFIALCGDDFDWSDLDTPANKMGATE